MACEECSIRFSVFKRKKQCGICLRYYCKHCLLSRRDDSAIKPSLMRFSDKKYMCRKCRILSARPLNRPLLLQLRVKDLQLYLSSQKISTRGCVEKDDLINLLLQHVNGANNVPRYSSTGFHSQTDLSRREDRQEQQQRSNSAEDFASYNNPLASASNVTYDQPVDTFRSSAATHLSSDLGSESGSISSDINLDRNNSEGGNAGNQWSNINHASVDEAVQQKESSDFLDKDAKFMACSGISLEDIKSLEEIEKLSVKQIKELLALNRVDFRGCVEKSELMERLSRLWHDNHKSRTDLDNLSLQELCKICMDAPVECVILECGHMATCMKCGKQLNECPICRQFVVRVVRTFRA